MGSRIPLSRTYHYHPGTLVPSVSHHAGLEGLIQVTPLLASGGHPTCGFLGDGALHLPPSLFLCPKVTMGIGLQMPSERFGVLGGEVVPRLPV